MASQPGALGCLGQVTLVTLVTLVVGVAANVTSVTSVDCQWAPPAAKVHHPVFGRGHVKLLDRQRNSSRSATNPLF